MTPATRTAFLQSRIGKIGGSDIGSLLSNQMEVEYGCERNLWARLSGVPTDNPDAETEVMTLGNVLEPFVRRAYCDQTGRSVVQHGLKKHGTVASLQYHDDGIITPAPGDMRTTNGVLEVKAIGREMMAKVNEYGLPPDYVLQPQAGMGVHDLTWASFAVGTRDDLLPLVAIEQAATLAGDSMPKLPRRPKIAHFDVERNDDIITTIEEYAPVFLATVGVEAKAPRRLDPEDPRCGRCSRAIWCQGRAIMESVLPENHIPQRRDLAPLIDEYRVNSALLEQCEALVGETEDKFRAALGGTTAVKVPIDGGWKNIIYRLRKGAMRVDGKAMAAQYDQLRRAAISAGVVGAELVPVSSEFDRVGGPSRPLLLKSLLPKKEKKKGEVPEVDSESDPAPEEY